MNELLIEKTIDYVKQFFSSDSSGHDYYHTLRVYKLANKIAQKEKADLFTVSLAALLHDVDDIKLSKETSKNTDNAVNFLRSNNVSEELISKIVKIISEVSFAGKDSIRPDSIESKCVQDADRIDAIGAIGIARTFMYGGSHNSSMYDPNELPLLDMDKDTYHNHKSTVINHFYEKLFLLKDMLNTGTAKEIANERDQFMHQFVDRFIDEFNGEK